MENVENARPARFPCGALNARKFTIVSREAASFFSFFYSFLLLPLFFTLFLSFPSFFTNGRKRKGDGSRSVRVDLLLHGWEGRTNLSRDEISLENEVDDHVNRFSSILFYVRSILMRNQRQDLRPLSHLLLRPIHIGAPSFTPSSFSIKKARKNIYTRGNYNYRLSVSLLILYDWSRSFRNNLNFKQFWRVCKLFQFEKSTNHNDDLMVYKIVYIYMYIYKRLN